MISSRFHTVLFEWNSGPISHKISWHTWPDIVHTVVTKVDTVWHGPIWPIRVHTGPKSVNRPWFLKTHSVSKSISPIAPTCSSPSIQASSPADEQSRDSIWFDLELTGSSWFWLHSISDQVQGIFPGVPKKAKKRVPRIKENRDWPGDQVSALYPIMEPCRKSKCGHPSTWGAKGKDCLVTFIP